MQMWTCVLFTSDPKDGICQKVKPLNSLIMHGFWKKELAVSMFKVNEVNFEVVYDDHQKPS